MAESPGEAVLLFFDTFSHENTEELNLDLIQFPTPVCISEVRIIPLGYKVEVKVPGGVRLGATNPSSFKLEIFANNLGHPRAATFEKVGQIDYCEDEIQLLVDERVVTDGLAIKGWYSAVTLAVYGTLSKAKIAEPCSPPPPPPPLQLLHSLQHVPNKEEVKASVTQWIEGLTMLSAMHAGAQPATAVAISQHAGAAAIGTPAATDGKAEDILNKEREEGSNIAGPSYTDATSEAHSPDDRRAVKRSQPVSPVSADKEAVCSEAKQAKKTDAAARDLTTAGSFDHLTPEHSPTNEQLYMSDQEIGCAGAADEQNPEEMDSEEELLAEDIITTDMTGYLDFEGAADEGWNFPVVSFNPYQCDLSPLCSFYSPVWTQYQIEKQRLTEDADMPEAAVRIVSIVETFQQTDHSSKWVEALETLPSLLPTGLPFFAGDSQGKSAVLKTLVDWTTEGLNLTKAVLQPDAPFKVRHLKMGIRMACALFSCDEEVTLRLLDCGVPEQLVDLLASECMASSIKMLIMRALDSCTLTRCGIEWLLGVHPMQRSGTGDGSVLPQKVTCYQRLLDLMLQKQLKRTAAGMSPLLQKIHVYDMLIKLQDNVKRVAARTREAAALMKDSPVDRDDSSSSEDSDDDMVAAREADAAEDYDSDAEDTPATRIPLQAIPALGLEHITDAEADIIMSSLNEAAFILRNAESTIAQPSRGLPLRIQFEVKYKPYDPFPGVYRMFHSCKVLEAIFVCLSSPITSSHWGIFTAIREFLVQLLKSQQGLLYLFHTPETANGIIRSLVQTGDLDKENEGDLHPCQQLGLQLIYYLQALQFIDQLKEYWDKDSQECDVDDAEAIGILHSLHIMTFTPPGKDAVVQVLGYDYNLEALLPFITPTGEEHVDAKMKESVCARYTAELLQLLMTYSENVEMLQKFAGKLLDVCAHEVASRAAGIQEWLQPLKDIRVLDCDSLPSLIDSFKKGIEGLPEISKGLVTTLRLLRHLAIAPVQEAEGVVELRYRFAILELHSADCLTILINLLQKLADKQLRGWQRGIPERHANRDRLMATVKPTLELVKEILTQLIAARTPNEFKDLSSLPALFSVYTVMCSLPPGGVYTDEVVRIQVNIVETLIAFTQAPVSAGSSDRDEVTVSPLWTSMVRELLKYVLTSPYTFLGGLMLVSELLPLPLPVAKAPSLHSDSHQTLTDHSLTDEIAVAAVNCRRQWSAHLQTVGPFIETILKSLAGTSCVHLQCVLRRVCWQLCDLSAGIAMLVFRSLLDALFENMDADKEVKATGAPSAASLSASFTATATAAVAPSPSVTAFPSEHDSLVKPALPSAAPTAASATALSAASQEAGQTASSGVHGSAKLEANSLTARTLGLIAYLVCHPPAKAAMLCMIRSSYDSKADEKYQQLLPKMFVLLNTVSEKRSHNQAQEFIGSILLSLCDPSISLLPPAAVSSEGADAHSSTSEQHCTAAARSPSAKAHLQLLLCSLPSPRESLGGIASAFLHHVADQDHGYASILAALRTLVLLAEHDYGFSCIRTALLENPLSLYHLLTRINNTFSKDSAECVSALTMTLELLCLLAFRVSGLAASVADLSSSVTGCNGGGSGDTGKRAETAHTLPRSSQRMLSLTSHELRKAVNWQTPVHPLDDLEKLLAEFAVEDSFENVVANIGKLMTAIRSDDAQLPSASEDGKLKDIETAFLQETPLPLSEQFARRNAQVNWCQDADDEKLNPTYWLTNQLNDFYVEDYDDKVTVNFEDWCKQYIKDFDLEADLKADNEDLVKAKPKTKYRRSDLFTVGGQSGRRGPYVAPMRARPRGPLRGGGGAGGGPFARPNDHFRTRAPNTSRPPSMHVDDFIKFEQGSGVGSGDKVSTIGGMPMTAMMAASNSDLMRRLDKTNFLPPMMQDGPMLRGRGRGFDRGRGRTRFQTTPANFKPGFPRGFRGGRGSRMNFIPNQRSPMSMQQPRGGGMPRGGGSSNPNMPMGGPGGLLKPYFPPNPRFSRGGGPGPGSGGMFNSRNDRRSFSPPKQGPGRSGERRNDNMRERFPKAKGRGGGGGGGGGGGHYMQGPFRDRDAMLMPPPIRSRDRLNKMDNRGPDRKHHRSYTK